MIFSKAWYPPCSSSPLAACSRGKGGWAVGRASHEVYILLNLVCKLDVHTSINTKKQWDSSSCCSFSPSSDQKAQPEQQAQSNRHETPRAWEVLIAARNKTSTFSPPCLMAAVQEPLSTSSIVLWDFLCSEQLLSPRCMKQRGGMQSSRKQPRIGSRVTKTTSEGRKRKKV